MRLFFPILCNQMMFDQCSAFFIFIFLQVNAILLQMNPIFSDQVRKSLSYMATKVRTKYLKIFFLQKTNIMKEKCLLKLVHPCSIKVLISRILPTPKLWTVECIYKITTLKVMLLQSLYSLYWANRYVYMRYLFFKCLFIRLEITELELWQAVYDENTSRACVSILPHLHGSCKWPELRVCCGHTLGLPLISWMLAASQGGCAYLDSLASWNDWNHCVLLQQYFRLPDMVPETRVVIK